MAAALRSLSARIWASSCSSEVMSMSISGWKPEGGSGREQQVGNPVGKALK